MDGSRKIQAVCYMNSFSLRKERAVAVVSGKRKRVERQVCPVGNCRPVIKKIHVHFTDVHKLKRDTSK